MVSATEILDLSVRVDYLLQVRSAWVFEPGERVMGVRDLADGHNTFVSESAWREVFAGLPEWAETCYRLLHTSLMNWADEIAGYIESAVGRLGWVAFAEWAQTYLDSTRSGCKLFVADEDGEIDA